MGFGIRSGRGGKGPEGPQGPQGPQGVVPFTYAAIGLLTMSDGTPGVVIGTNTFPAGFSISKLGTGMYQLHFDGQQNLFYYRPNNNLVRPIVVTSSANATSQTNIAVSAVIVEYKDIIFTTKNASGSLTDGHEGFFFAIFYQ